MITEAIKIIIDSWMKDSDSIILEVDISTPEADDSALVEDTDKNSIKQPVSVVIPLAGAHLYSTDLYIYDCTTQYPTLCRENQYTGT
eukprot:snap_masked-scaffold_11-processed-gene-0.7-mRNA-1 protein AED:1.00 eAED:1.00 QI:0/-1/0/0/-1/1/1/0/86